MDKLELQQELEKAGSTEEGSIYINNTFVAKSGKECQLWNEMIHLSSDFIVYSWFFSIICKVIHPAHSPAYICTVMVKEQHTMIEHLSNKCIFIAASEESKKITWRNESGWV